jgi:hypothetical protein
MLVLLVGEKNSFGARLLACAFARAYSRAGAGAQRGHKDFFMSSKEVEPARLTGVS